jgi:hypothetical protein
MSAEKDPGRGYRGALPLARRSGPPETGPQHEVLRSGERVSEPGQRERPAMPPVRLTSVR